MTTAFPDAPPPAAPAADRHEVPIVIRGKFSVPSEEARVAFSLDERLTYLLMERGWKDENPDGEDAGRLRLSAEDGSVHLIIELPIEIGVEETRS